MVDAVVFSVSAGNVSVISVKSLMLMVVEVFSGIRVYVLCPSNVWLAGIVAGIALANPAVAMVSQSILYCTAFR